jgi:hypothetical protein
MASRLLDYHVWNELKQKEPFQSLEFLHHKIENVWGPPSPNIIWYNITHPVGAPTSEMDFER